MPTKAHLMTAAVALAAFAVISMFQQKVMKVPVIGDYLPS